MGDAAGADDRRALRGAGDPVAAALLDACQPDRGETVAAYPEPERELRPRAGDVGVHVALHDGTLLDAGHEVVLGLGAARRVDEPRRVPARGRGPEVDVDRPRRDQQRPAGARDLVPAGAVGPGAVTRWARSPPRW